MCVNERDYEQGEDLSFDAFNVHCAGSMLIV